MSESDTDGHFTSGIPTVLLVVVISVPLVFAVFAYNFFVPASEENTRTFLRTLVQAESSIIAIVFSVIFLGVQIISSRYTSRMGRLFFEIDSSNSQSVYYHYLLPLIYYYSIFYRRIRVHDLLLHYISQLD